MCLGGSGGGGDGGAAAAAAAEKKRQKQIKDGLKRVSNAFRSSKRSPIYRRIQDDTLAQHRDDLAEQFTDALLQQRFGAARRGMTASSVDADEQSDLRDRRDEGLLAASNLARQARTRAVAADEDTRQRLIQMVYGGLSAGSARSQASRLASVNATQSAADARMAQLGQVFADLTAAHQGGQAQAGRILAQRAFQNGGNGSAYFNSGGAYSGSVT